MEMAEIKEMRDKHTRTTKEEKHEAAVMRPVH